MPFHAVAILSGNRTKTIPNRTEEQILSQIVIPFVANGVVNLQWGKKTNAYQVLELRIYKTDVAWDKKAGAFNDVIMGKKNIVRRFEVQARKLLSTDKPKVFLVTPIQGTKHGDQEQQRIKREYDERFEAVEKIVGNFGCVAIRIDREQALEDLVTRIKREIKTSLFVIADLTDERPSCYFEAGYAEATSKPIIYVASHNSVLKPGNATKIHFDIHMNVQFFTNHKELEEKLTAVIEKNKEALFPNNKASDDTIVLS